MENYKKKLQQFYTFTPTTVEKLKIHPKALFHITSSSDIFMFATFVVVRKKVFKITI